MSDQFQNKFLELSENFQKELAITRREINDNVEKKLQSVQSFPENDGPQENVTVNVTKPTESPVQLKEKNDSQEVISNSSENNVNKQVIYVRSDKLIDLPSFDGRFSDWPMFIGQYTQTTRNQGYDDVDNNIRLNKALTGNTKKLVEPLLINPRNVSQVMYDLQDRFGRPELLAEQQIALIRNHPNIPEHRLFSIVDLADKVRNCKNFLLTCGCDSYIENPLLVREISEKLPLGKKIDWPMFETTLKRPANLEDLSTWMTEYSRYLQRINFPNQSRTQENSDHSERKRGLYTQKVDCILCSNNHSLESCDQFIGMDCAKRFNFCKENGICYSFLKKGHSKNICRNKKDCEFEGCKHNHHPLLHFETTKSFPASISN